MSLAKYRKKKFKVREYECPVFEDTFYFKNKTVADEQAVLNGMEAYGDDETVELHIAIILYMQCNKGGKREFDSFVDPKLKAAVDELKENDGFLEHYPPAFSFAWTGKQMKPEDLTSDEPGSIDAAKKPSSAAESNE